ncbi:MAG: hypothetical protein KGQ66_23220 [Acidobacteriota bacterium]|nr:hypothetical protein [Acidobacteriota bacterium]
MSIDIPSWLQPVLDFYEIPWPDVDEDAFHDMRQPLRNFGQDLDAVGAAIDSALADLESGNPSHTLRAISTYFASVKRDFLDPVRSICDGLAGWPCDVAYDAIVAVKVAIIGLLTTEIIDDAAAVVATAVTFGLDSAVTFAEAAGVREMVAESLSIAEGDVASRILSAANTELDNFVSSLLNPFISSVSARVQGEVDAYIPRLVLQQAFAAEQSAIDAEAGAAARLHLSPSELEHCVESITTSSVHLDQATKKLDSAIEEVFSHPAPSPSPSTASAALRSAVKGVVQTVEADLVGGLRSLIDHVIGHFVTLLQDYKRALDDLDQEARVAASQHHARLGAPVVALSAAGLGTVVAAGVGATSGLVNSAKAQPVQVEVVTAAEDGDSIAVAVDTTVVSAGPATANDTADHIEVRVATATATAGPASATGGGVTEVRVKVDAEGPHVVAAQSGSAPGAPVGAHGAEHHVRTIHDVSPTRSNDDSRLQAAHPDRPMPNVGAATSSAHGVTEVKPKPTPAPIVEGSTVFEEAE